VALIAGSAGGVEPCTSWLTGLTEETEFIADQTEMINR
jgi:hypothetical protein